MRIILKKCVDAVYKKLSKLVHACRDYSLPNLARFLRHSVNVYARVHDCMLGRRLDIKDPPQVKSLLTNPPDKIPLCKTSPRMKCHPTTD